MALLSLMLGYLARNGAFGLTAERVHLTQPALSRSIQALEADLVVDQVHELRGAFLVRPGHPLARRSGLRFEDLAPYPLASIPLSHEVARLLVERYGPTAHPQQAVTLRSDDIGTLVAVAEHSDAVLPSVRATGPGLVDLALNPPLAISARLGLVTLARRTPPPALARLRMLMGQRLVEPGPISRASAHAATSPATKARTRKG